MILNHIFLLLILASLVIIPCRFYGKKKSVRFTVRMMYSEKARLFLSSLLGVLVCVFHMVYYSIHPLEKGLLISSLYVFFCFMSKKNMKILMQVRKSKFAIVLLVARRDWLSLRSSNVFLFGNLGLHHNVRLSVPSQDEEMEIQRIFFPEDV